MPAILGTRRAEELDAPATSTGLDHGLAKFSVIVSRRGSRRGTGAVGGGTTRSFVHGGPLLIRPAAGRGHAGASTAGRARGLPVGILVRRHRQAAHTR